MNAPALKFRCGEGAPHKESRRHEGEVRSSSVAVLWEEKRLGDIGFSYNGLSGKCKNDFGHGKGRYVTYMNVFSNPIAKTDQCDAIEIDKRQNEVKKGDIFFTTSSETPEEVGMSSVWMDDEPNVYLNSFCFGYRPKPGNVSEFLAYLLRANGFRKAITFLAQGISRYNISKTRVMDISVFLPNEIEQRKIGSFFRTLDALIGGREKALGKLKSLKKAMLQKMFPHGDAKIPEVRFRGFEGEWEEKQLGDIVRRVTRKNTNLESELPLTISAEHGLISQYEFFNNRVAARDVSGYYLVVNGEFAYNKSTSDGWPWGVVKRLTRYPMGVLSTLYIVFSLNDKDVDAEYIERYFETTLWHDDVSERAAEGARNHGLLNITPDDFFATHILLPDLLEQQRIGAYFRSLDSLLAARQEELDKLHDLKKALLERMFA